MRSRLLSFATLLGLTAAGAAAQGFLPFGGFTGNSHYAIETVASGFTATADAVLSHGSVPAASTYKSGIGSIADDLTQVKVTLSADSQSLLVEGVADGCRYQLYGIDGRMLADGNLRRGSISLSRLPAGHYLLRLTSVGQAPCVNHFLKR